MADLLLLLTRLLGHPSYSCMKCGSGQKSPYSWHQLYCPTRLKFRTTMFNRGPHDGTFMLGGIQDVPGSDHIDQLASFLSKVRDDKKEMRKDMALRDDAVISKCKWVIKDKKIKCPAFGCKYHLEKGELLDHFEQRHDNLQKTIPCPMCDTMFLIPKQVVDHLWLRHSTRLTKEPFECDVCGVTSRAVQMFETHKLQSHPPWSPLEIVERMLAARPPKPVPGPMRTRNSGPCGKKATK